MENKYIRIGGVQLFYAEAHPDAGASIFFFHGNSSSHATWQQQLESPELSFFRLIAFDLPAHGSSDSASEPTNGYSLPGIGALMAKAVLQLSDGKPFLLAGVSLGGNIIAEMMAHAVHPAGILLAGPCLLGGACTPAKIMKPDTCVGLSFTDEITGEEMTGLLKLIIHRREPSLDSRLMEDIRNVRDSFRSSAGKAVAAGLLSDEVALIKSRDVPVLVIFGEADLAFYTDFLDNAGFRLWKDSIVKIPGAGHWVQLDEPELFTKLLQDFAGDLLPASKSR